MAMLPFVENRSQVPSARRTTEGSWMAEQFPLQGSGSGQVLVVVVLLLLSASITPAFKRLIADRSWKIDFMMQGVKSREEWRSEYRLGLFK
jgi:hypothetical protein